MSVAITQDEPMCRRFPQTDAPGGGSSPADECSSAHDLRPLARRRARLGRPPCPRPARCRRGNPVRRGPGPIQLAAQALAQWHSDNLTPRAGRRRRVGCSTIWDMTTSVMSNRSNSGPRDVDAVIKQVGQLDQVRRLSFFNGIDLGPLASAGLESLPNNGLSRFQSLLGLFTTDIIRRNSTVRTSST